MSTNESATKGLNKTAIAIAMIVATISLIGYYLYLTNDRYYILTSGMGVAYEVDRRTGETWVLHGSTKRRQVDQSLEAMPDSDKSRITVENAALTFESFSATLHNRSEWTVEELVFQIITDEQSMQLKKAIKIEPFSTVRFSITTDVGDGASRRFNWELQQVRGYRGN
ncbi:MAG: hypothetical protein O3C40_09020 [Planctomycetota bacterium]|nr:hypothetical protein [Planctomycetota bacterium]